MVNKVSATEMAVRIAALGLLGGMLLSWPLWNPDARTAFPVFPVFGEPHQPNAAGISSLWQALFSVVLVFSVAILPHYKNLLVVAVLWLLGLCVTDINRLQPWVWFYLLIFGTALLGKKQREYRTVAALRWILAGVYFWGGFNKLTPYFADDNFAWFCNAFALTKPAGQFPALGYAVAALEMLFAAGILWEKTRRYFRWLILGFHGVIVLFLLKLNWNLVVIPWNTAMAAIVWILCAPGPSLKLIPADSTPAPAPFFSPERLGAGLTWLLPLLQLFHLWPHSLSWQMYSNTQPEAAFYTETGGIVCTPEMAICWKKLSFDEGSKLQLDDWAADELKVPVFSSEAIFRRAGRYLCRCASVPDSAGLYILTVNRWDKSGEKMVKIPCREMMNDE